MHIVMKNDFFRGVSIVIYLCISDKFSRQSLWTILIGRKHELNENKYYLLQEIHRSIILIPDGV